MNLIVDAGNTTVKLAVFKGRKLIFDQLSKPENVAREIKEICDYYTEISNGIIASVGNLDRKVLAVLSVFCKVHELSHASKVPFKNSYATPQTLGVDRIALSTSAFYFNPKGNTLVIDAGSCITYDMINDFGEYLGGAIAPGMRMRYRAMHEQTSKLPYLEAKDINDFIGNTTETSLHSGVVNGICMELEGVINQYKSRFKDLTVILTGGDGQFLSKRLKNTIFAHPKFLLEGLNYLLEYNKQ